MIPVGRDRGFALLMVLMVVLLAGAALAGAVRHSTSLAMEAVNAEQRLQRRWATQSISATLLPHAERLISEVDRNASGEPDDYLNDPVTHRYIACELAGTQYELVVTDEQSKLNVNRLYDGHDREDLRSALREVIRDSGADWRGMIELQLRPQVAHGYGQEHASLAVAAAAFGGYGQLFDRPTPTQLLGTPDSPGPATRVTLWGDGRLNIRRASPKAIIRLCGNLPGADWARPLADAVAAGPYRPLSQVMKDIDDLEPADRAQIRRHLTDMSTCHGLWVIAHGPQRAWHALLIAESIAPNPPERDDTPYDTTRRVTARHQVTW